MTRLRVVRNELVNDEKFSCVHGRLSQHCAFNHRGASAFVRNEGNDLRCKTFTAASLRELSKRRLRPKIVLPLLLQVVPEA